MAANERDIKSSPSSQVEEAWNHPLFDALMGRRSRRFGLGMEIEAGPFAYKSEKDPIPLTRLEEAMCIAAATGTNGPILCEGEKQGRMVKAIGATHPSAVGSRRTQLFFSNDSGTYLYKTDAAKMSKMREYENPEDHDKVLNFYDQYTVKLQDGRIDIPRETPALFAHNLWVTNKPGSTLFMPVTDISKDLIKLMFNMCDGKDGRYIDGGGYYIVDERDDMRPLVPEKWVKKGIIDRNKVLPLGRLEKIVVSWLCAEGAMMGTLMQLAFTSMGLGGWMHGGFTPLMIMGGTPTCKGLGFRFQQTNSDPFPNPVGLDGYFEGCCPPYYPDMNSAVEAVAEGQRQSLDEWQAQGMVLPQKQPDNATFDRENPAVSDEGVEVVKDVATAMYERYGKFPAHNDTMHLLYFIQAHHLDLDFYDEFFKDGAYLKTHKEHFCKWHGGK